MGGVKQPSGSSNSKQSWVTANTFDLHLSGLATKNNSPWNDTWWSGRGAQSRAAAASEEQIWPAADGGTDCWMLAAPRAPSFAPIGVLFLSIQVRQLMVPFPTHT